MERRDAVVKILLVSPGLPANGARERAQNVVGALSDNGHVVDLLTAEHLVRRQKPGSSSLPESALRQVFIVKSSSISAFVRASGALLRGRSMRAAYAQTPGLRKKVRKVSPNYDIVLLKRKRMGGLVDAVSGSAKVILDMTDSVTLWELRVAMMPARFKVRALSAIDLPGTAYEERSLVMDPRFNQVWFASPDDLRFTNHVIGRPVANAKVVPNVVAPSFFAAMFPAAPTPVAVFAADFDQPTNQIALDWLLNDVLPLVDSPVELHVVGRGSERFLRRRLSVGNVRVERIGYVEDLPETLRSSWVILAPMLAGAGTKNKVLQGLAVDRPVVTTTIGAEGIGSSADCPGLFVEDDPEDFAMRIDAVIKLGPQEFGCRRYASERFSSAALKDVLAALI